MSPPSPIWIWFDRILLAVIAFVLIMMPLLPIDLTPTRWAQPDFLFILFYAVTIRRPRVAPFWLLGVLLLACDFLWMSPMGLWAAIGLVALEVARSNRRAVLENLFLGEVLWFGAIFLAALLVEWMLQAIFLIPRATLTHLLTIWALSLLVYPLMAGLMHVFLGLYRDRSLVTADEERLA